LHTKSITGNSSRRVDVTPIIVAIGAVRPSEAIRAALPSGTAIEITIRAAITLVFVRFIYSKVLTSWAIRTFFFAARKEQKKHDKESERYNRLCFHCRAY